MFPTAAAFFVFLHRLNDYCLWSFLKTKAGRLLRGRSSHCVWDRGRQICGHQTVKLSWDFAYRLTVRAGLRWSVTDVRWDLRHVVMTITTLTASTAASAGHCHWRNRCDGRMVFVLLRPLYHYLTAINNRISSIDQCLSHVASSTPI